MARVTRIALDLTLEACKTVKPAIGTAWQYAKTEMVPPLTVNFFHGPVGRDIENAVSKAGDTVIALIQKQIRQIELEEVRQIKLREAEAKAVAAKIKAEAKRKAEEAKKMEDENFAKEAKAKQQAEAGKKAQATQKVTADAAKKSKTETSSQKVVPKKKAAKRKAPKKNRRGEKKGSSPKSKN